MEDDVADDDDGDGAMIVVVVANRRCPMPPPPPPAPPPTSGDPDEPLPAARPAMEDSSGIRERRRNGWPRIRSAITNDVNIAPMSHGYDDD